MGFFLTAAVAETINKPSTGRRKKLVDDASNAPTGCDACTLQRTWPSLLTSRMPMQTQEGADILILGENPNSDSDLKGKPFVGNMASLLQRCYSARDNDRLAYQNVIRCKPTSNQPLKQDIHACSGHLADDILRLRPKAILGLGGVALQSFYPGAAIQRIHGMKFPVQVGDHVCWYFPVMHPEIIDKIGGERSTLFPVLRAEVKSFFNDIDIWPKPRIHKFEPGNVMLPQTYDDACEILAAMQGPIAIDFETKQLRPYMPDALMLTCGASDGELSMAWSIDHPQQPTDWGWQLVKDIVSKHLWVCHSSAMELSWIWHRMGIRDWDPTPFEDTMTLGRVQHNRETQLGLGAMTRIHLGVDVKKLTDVDAKRIMEYPIKDVLIYNGLDAEATALLRKYFVRQRNHEDRPDTDRYRRNVMRAINTTVSTTYMELKGLPINLETTQKFSDQFTATKEKVAAHIRTLYEVQEFERTFQQEFNIGNSEHVGMALVKFGKCELPETINSKKKMAEGTSSKVRFSTDDAALAPHVDTNPLAKAVTDWRENDKILSTWVTPLLTGSLIMPDGLLHPQYTVLHTATMRLSSTDPNIQNWPKRKNREIRAQIDALLEAVYEATGIRHIIIAFDYAQLEARILAMASGDTRFIREIIEGVDVHSFWRDRMLYHYPEYMLRVSEKSDIPIKVQQSADTDKKLMKAARDWIKNDYVFAGFYGSTSKSKAVRLKVPEFVMNDLDGEFWENYRGVENWIKRQRATYRDTGQVELITGVIRADVMNGNEPINTPIQGSAAHVVLEAQNAIAAKARREKDFYLHPRINIHDDLTFIIPDTDESLDYYIPTIAKELVKPRFDWSTVPLAVEVNVGYNWSDLHEIAVFKGDYIL